MSFLQKSGCMNKELTLSFIGGGNMATALAAGVIGKRCGAHDVHVIDVNGAVLDRWKEQGVSVASAPSAALSRHRIWVLAVKPQHMKEIALSCRPFLKPETLVISIAAGIQSATLAQWLGAPGRPWTRLVRCMPNTPALISAGASGLMALEDVSLDDRAIVQQLMGSVGEVVWVDSDSALDAVTALSGSGPAYVFLFIEALIEGAKKLGLSDDQSRTLALATLNGATQLAALSHESPAALRERVTSKGGTTAAAIAILEEQNFSTIVQHAMQAAADRAGELAVEFGRQ